MMPSEAITAACGIGSTRSAQMRAMPRAHAQLPYFRSDSRASLASWGVGIVAQEASASARTPITIRTGLISPSDAQGWSCETSAFIQWLQPAAHAALVIAIGVAEPPFQVRLLARYDAAADRNGQRQCQDQGPRAARGHGDAGVHEKQTQVDGIAAPAVNPGRDQRAGGLVRGHWRRRPREVANTCGCERKTDEDEGAGDRPAERVASRNGEGDRQPAIRSEAEQKSGEKEK